MNRSISKYHQRAMPITGFIGVLALLGGGALLLLAGCAPVGPNYQKPQLELPVAWSGGASQATARPADREQLGHWWILFNDPLLESLINRAATANQDRRIAEARLLQARAQYRLTTAASTPTAGVSGGYSNNRKSENAGSNGGSTSSDLFQTGFDAGWEIDFFGGVRRGTEAAEARLAAAEENSSDVLVSLEAEVARSYLELRSSQQRLAAARENLGIQEQTLELTRGRRESGLASELEVAQARTQLAQTSAQIPPLENSSSQAIYRLALLLGLAPQALTAELSPVTPPPTFSPGLPATLPSDLLRRRPDIRRAERQLAAATADIGVATAELFPRFSLTGLIGLQSANLSDLLSTGSRYWTVGPTVRWSLFDGGRVRANIDLNLARREEAQAIYEKTVLTALNEVENTLVALSREEETSRALAEATASGQRAAELALGRYRAGLAGFLEVLQSEHALSQARDQLLQSDQRLSAARVALFKGLGGGWEISSTQNVPGEIAAPRALAPSTTSAGDQQP